MSRNEPILAIDGRLIGGTSTGDSTYWTCLVPALAALESSIRIVIFSDSPRPESFAPTLEWVHLPAKTSRWWSLVQFPLAARRRGCSAVHVQYTLSPLARNGITTIHDVSFLIGPEWFKPKDRLLLSATVPRSAKRAARVITVSETSRREIESLVPTSKGKVRATPLACPPWISKQPKQAAIERLRSIGITAPFMLSVGTRWPRKNMDLAVQAANLLPSDLPHKLVLTGKTGWGSHDLGERVLTTGYVSNEVLCDLYSAADLYVAPSRHEGFGIPLLEAFRCGSPVICSAGGAFPEVAGDAAIVESSWEPSHWAATMERLLRDASTLESLRASGFERERQFTWQATAERTLEVYREVTM